VNISQAWTRDHFAQLETLYHTANGCLGVRAAPEEGAVDGVDSIRGTYLNAFYEIKDVRYGEKLFGFPETQQVMVNLPDAQTVTLQAQGETFSMFGDAVTERLQTLSMEGGYTRRQCRWQTSQGALRVDIQRLTSFVHQGLFAMRYRVTSEDYAGDLCLNAMLNADVRNHAVANDPRVAAEPLRCLEIRSLAMDGDNAVALVNTLRSNLSVCCRVAWHCDWPKETSVGHSAINRSWSGCLRKGEQVELTVLADYADSRRFRDPVAQTCKELSLCQQLGMERLLIEQAEWLADFWQASRVTVEGDEQLQLALDYDVFELLQSTGRDGVSNVAAKGLSGEGYEGHTFWDSEIYVFPFFLWTNPATARELLRYRCGILDRARANARSLGFAKGALFPWRTIDGDECSAYYPAGSAQYHINGDIAFAFIQYWLATGDLRFMAEQGAQVLVETARFWLELGHMAEDGFRMECVTGPDEYTCLVNNNFYTNATAQYNLRGAVRLVQRLREAGMDGDVRAQTGVTDVELASFTQAADRMYFPKDERYGVSPQDDSFLQKAVLDISAIPRDNFPLLLHYHPLFLYRYQVCKQADTVLAHLLFPYTADEDTVRRSYHYYERVTTHDSSLSQCVFTMMAARLGYMDQAVALFSGTVDLDRGDTHGNTRDGLHTANMGGSYLCVLRGFAGLALTDNGLALAPTLPPGWEGYAFNLCYLGSRIHCMVTPSAVNVTLLTGEPVELSLHGQRGLVKQDGFHVLTADEN